jgi:uncharacterized protein (DUF2384 family)
MEEPMTATASRIRAATEQNLGLAGLRTFFRITELWQLTPDQQMTLLGLTSPSTYYKWKKTPPQKLSPDMLERLSYIFGIYKALQILLPNERQADTWVHRPNTNPLFGGRPPLERMLSGQVADLYVVRRHLDAARGGWP